ncbi:transcriptional regulator [Mycolicibacterium litorale]|uniref:Transcriptional regulator n=1 Tax=Mycolicibacterium litorale TaxID=758802 RepID=A0A6S6P350_9MYCO|nr:helix-turn-helix domain-containing protein [Mycolicibacterium litorale]BCI53164.1 transcriptional regulator [Mycolicibacterium litorale]
MGMAKTWTGRGSARALRDVHDVVVAGQVSPAELRSGSLRPLVAESWQRSLSTGVDPDRDGALASRTNLAAVQRRAEHPLAAALPVIRRLLVDDAIDSGVVVAVTAADGTLLWVEGDPVACRQAEAMNFVPGADWSEHSAGTNAPGTALALDRELQIDGPEHFFRIAQPWSCAASPVHDPATGALLGAIDLTGGSQVASAQALALVRATAVAVENHLALLQLRPAPAEPATPPRLTVLGAERPRWQLTDDHGRVRTVSLTGRHAEILALLVRNPQGLSTDHLALLLDEKDLDVVTVRAEMSRLRRVIGSEFIGSRPYRLLQPVVTDFGDVFDALAAGDVETAVREYRGPVLPQSSSPSIARLRTELSASVRGAVIGTGDLTLLHRWLELPEGRDDRDGWRLLYEAAAPGSAGWVQARGRLAGIDFEFG